LTLGTVHVAVVRAIHGVSDAGLFEVVDAGCLLSPGFGAGESRQKHRREDGDDRDDNEQLNECEAAAERMLERECTWTTARAEMVIHRA
jgi:hypothetical protein